MGGPLKNMRRHLALISVFFVALAGLEALRAAEGPAPTQVGPRLARVSGDNQTVQPGVPFALVVQRVDVAPLAGVDVGVIRVLSGGPAIECQGSETDSAGFAVLTCNSGFWPIRTQILITVADETGLIAADFGITITLPSLPKASSPTAPPA